MADISQTETLSQRARDRRNMLFMENLIYPVFLVIVLAGRLLPRRRQSAGGQRPLTVSAEASELTHSVVPWFFVFR
ncbi:hypothetical protein [Hyphomonas sp.]|uniref:hypothetical protein n=1 Tax=Hyphomonas sp. TaxID=87 RepID=UPI00391C7AD3